MPAIVVASISAVALASARPWTNTEGKTIEAEYVSHTATSVVISINGKRLTYSVDKLSQADRDYLAGLKPPAALPANAPVTGERKGVRFTTHLHDAAGDYFGGNVRASVLSALESGMEKFANPGTKEDWFKRNPDKDTYRIYVPASYDGSTPYGLLVHIDAGDPGGIPEKWYPMLDELQIIAVSAENIGNRHPTLRRVMWSMDAMANAEKEYRIDPVRTAITGTKEGGRVAVLTAVMYPDRFLGAICHASPVYLPIDSYGHFPGVSMSAFQTPESKNLKWMVIGGNRDRDYFRIVENAEQWKSQGLQYRFLDVPDMGATAAAAAPMKEALQWIGLGK